MKNYLYLFLMGCTFLIAGCASDSTDDLTEPIDEGPVTYLGNVQSIFNNNCVSCHGAIAPQAGLSLHTYETARAAVESSIVVTRMTSVADPMPPSGLLPGTTVDIVQQWIADGYLEE